MVAKDFITNVTNVFPTALARVVHNEQDHTQMRYTMKGISARAVPIDLRGRAYTPCLWKIPVRQTTEPTDENDENVMQPPENLSDQCDYWFSPTNAAEMWVHMVEEHLEVPRDNTDSHKFNDSTLKSSGRMFACLWAGCNRYPAPGIEDAHRVSMHVKVHLPDHGPGALARARFSRDRDRSASPPRHERYQLNTPTDERGNPVGLPLSAVLVLRNLARQMLKIDEGGGASSAGAEEEGGEEEVLGPSSDGGLVARVEPGAGLVLRHFGLHVAKLSYVQSNNHSLRLYMPDLMDFVTRGVHMGYDLPRLVGPLD
jgi:chromatin structure-remodeling complex subunit RSC9